MGRIAPTLTGQVVNIGSKLVRCTLFLHNLSAYFELDACIPNIEEYGIIEYATNTANYSWATQKMFDADNTWNVTIPSCIKPGPYVIRHETMAIQGSKEAGGVQFYPQCSQVWISGGTDPIEPELVALPGDIQPDSPSVLFDPSAAMDALEYTPP